MWSYNDGVRSNLIFFFHKHCSTINQQVQKDSKKTTKYWNNINWEKLQWIYFLFFIFFRCKCKIEHSRINKKSLNLLTDLRSKRSRDLLMTPGNLQSVGCERLGAVAKWNWSQVGIYMLDLKTFLCFLWMQVDCCSPQQEPTFDLPQ